MPKKKKLKLPNRYLISIGIFVLLAVLGLIDPRLRDQVAETLNVSNSSSGRYSNPDTPLESKKHSPLRAGVWMVVHIADGDTFDVVDDTGEKYRIRLIGANTPETVKPNSPVEPYGPEASAFTKSAIAAADNRVRIAFDGSQIDKYGRNLAMVYLQLPQGEVWLNEWLIREGLAKAELQYSFSQGAKQRLRQAETEAKNAKKNIWSRNAP
ncbi:thermonuclease [Planctomycetales bacterium]|nr:thermonuclease [Planctomycetales bacterium]